MQETGVELDPRRVAFLVVLELMPIFNTKKFGHLEPPSRAGGKGAGKPVKVGQR
jgi:hypothetical protein